MNRWLKQLYFATFLIILSACGGGANDTSIQTAALDDIAENPQNSLFYNSFKLDSVVLNTTGSDLLRIDFEYPEDSMEFKSTAYFADGDVDEAVYRGVK